MADFKFNSPVTRVEVDGAVTLLRFGHAGMVWLQDKWGLSSLSELNSKLAGIEKGTTEELGDLLQASMIFDRPGVTDKEAAAFTNSLGIADLVAVVGTVLKSSQPPAGAAQARPQSPAGPRKRPR
jgi:ABC-type amino acid transport substrate-binding protein